MWGPQSAGRVFPVASPWAHMRDAIPSFVLSQGKCGEIKDIKDFKDIKDAPKRLSLKSPLGSSVPLSLHTRLPCKAPYMHGKRKGVIAGPSGHSVRDEHLRSLW